MIIPSIDLMDGKAVQLKQGNRSAILIEKDNPLELANDFKKYGEVAVIDLDAAFGTGNNLNLIKEICKVAECRVGGGIRTIERANELLQAGAKKVILGTKASPEFLRKLPKDRIIVALDSKKDKVVVKAWKESTAKTALEVIKETEKYCSGFLFTNVDREGLMQGIDLGKVKEIKKATNNKITIAGGITTVEDIKALENLDCDSQIGMALYTNKIELEKAFINQLDFTKNNGLIPTIVQDEQNQVLMLAFSSKESLLQTFKTNQGTYYSRSRGKLWMKGETSRNTQQFIKARYDCDKDALLFTVKQKNAACHTEQYSCFGEKEFNMNDLFEIINNRIMNPKTNSYTTKIAQDENLILKKIKEESEEIINYKDKQNLIWEIADLQYFLLVLMAKKGITPKDVSNELWRRRK